MTGISKTFTLSGNSFTAWFRVEETYDIASNTSVLSLAEMKVKTSDWYGITMYLDGEIKINGQTVVSMSMFQGTHNVHINSKNEYAPVHGSPAPPWKSGNIPHSSDGSGSTTVSVNISGQSSGGGVRFRINGSEAVQLTKIPRVSEPTMSTYNTKMGNSVTIYTNRKSTAFTHNIRFDFASYTSSVNGIGDSYTWNIPMLASYIPNATSGVCTVTVATYSGSTKIGERKMSLTLVVPQTSETKPIIDSVSISPFGSVPSVFSGLYIRYKTGAIIKINARSQHSSISKYFVSVDGQTYDAPDGNVKTSLFNNSGDINIAITVRDSRGFESYTSKTISVISYGYPAVVPYPGNNRVVAVRSTRDGTPATNGGSLLIQGSRKYAKVESNGIPKNFCSLQYRIRTGTGAFGSWLELLSKDDPSDDVNKTISDAVPSPASSYDIEIQAVDAFGGSTPISIHIPTDRVSLHIRDDGDGIAFGKYSEKTAFECSMDSYFDQDIYGRLHSLGNLPQVPLNGDLHDYFFKAGTYCVPTYETARTVKNIPEPTAGTFTVWGSTGANPTGGPWTYSAMEYRTVNGVHYRKDMSTDGNTNVTYSDWKLLNGKSEIIAEGTSGNWRWRKWSSGIAECWGSWDTYNSSPTSVNSVVIFDSRPQTVALPFPFTKPPVVVPDGWCEDRSDGTGYSGWFGPGYHGKITETSVYIPSFWRGAHGGSPANLHVKIYVIGEWK